MASHLLFIVASHLLFIVGTHPLVDNVAASHLVQCEGQNDPMTAVFTCRLLNDYCFLSDLTVPCLTRHVLVVVCELQSVSMDFVITLHFDRLKRPAWCIFVSALLKHTVVRMCRSAPTQLQRQ